MDLLESWLLLFQGQRQLLAAPWSGTDEGSMALWALWWLGEGGDGLRDSRVRGTPRGRQKSKCLTVSLQQLSTEVCAL